MVAILWDGLFGRLEPLDVKALMLAQLELVFGEADRKKARPGRRS